jgi:hypothetical protein
VLQKLIIFHSSDTGFGDAEVDFSRKAVLSKKFSWAPFRTRRVRTIAKRNSSRAPRCRSSQDASIGLETNFGGASRDAVQKLLQS